MAQIIADSYRPRNPRDSDYYRCTQDHFEQLEMAWDDRYGLWRLYVMDVIRRYLDCGDLHFGFARVKCSECPQEYLLPFSCKRRHFCPSCHQKCVVEFGDWLCEEVLMAEPHRQWVFSIPKILRKFFMIDRRLPCKLSRYAWRVLSLCLTETVAYDDAMAGAAVTMQTFGNFQNFNPHLHIIVTDG